MGIDKDGYYSLREILGYNCKYNIVLSDRGRGKSYGTKRFLIEQEGTSMCLYRNTPDMASAMTDWIDPVVEQGWSPEQFEFDGSDKEGYILYYNGTAKIWFRAITMVNHIKQEHFPNDMNWVWLDEFIPLVYKKLPGVVSEGDAIRTIVKTIEHDSIHSREEKGLKPVRVLMFANPFTWNNPILSYFKVKPIYGIHRIGPGVVSEILEPMPQKEGGKMTVDEFLGDEVNRNQGFLNQDAFVVKDWPKGLIPKYSMRFGQMYFTFYAKAEGGRKLYVKRTKGHTDIQKMNSLTGKPVLVRYGTMDGLQEDEECIDNLKMFDSLKRMAWKGDLWFDDINCKFDFLSCIG